MAIPGWDIEQLIRDQHDEIRRLLDAVPDVRGQDRRDAFAQLVTVLAAHEATEAEAVYPVVRSSGAPGDVIVDARTREEDRTRAMVADLVQVGVDSHEFAPRFAVLRDLVLRHARSEEATVLPLLRPAGDHATTGRREA